MNDSIWWTVKAVMFIAIEVFVVGTVWAVLIVATYEIVTNKVRSLRRAGRTEPRWLRNILAPR